MFCFLISEARETTALEMPDHENTFVLKADNNMEYVIEAKDTDEMRSWLATIRYCMKSTPTSQAPPSSDSTGANSSTISQTSTILPAAGITTNPTTSSGSDTQGATAATSTNSANGVSQNSNDVNSSNAPELPPRPDERISSSSNFELTEGDLHDHDDSDLTAIMREYPWFHSTLPRSEASSMVLHGGSASHGVFLGKLQSQFYL